MEGSAGDTPYYPLNYPGGKRSNSTGEWADLVSSEKLLRIRGGSVISGDSNPQSHILSIDVDSPSTPAEELLVYHAEQPRVLDTSSVETGSADSGKKMPTSTRGERERTVSFWVSSSVLQLSSITTVLHYSSTTDVALTANSFCLWRVSECVSA